MNNQKRPPPNNVSRRIAQGKLLKQVIHARRRLTHHEALRLIHELQIHQIELQAQNQTLVDLHSQLEKSLERYTQLYQFAPTGHYTLSGNGTLHEVNLAGAALLGTDCPSLINRRFGLFISAETRPCFNDFLARVMSSGTKEVCEATLAIEGVPPRYLHLEGIATSANCCLLATIDITARKQVEAALEATEANAVLEKNRLEAILAALPTGVVLVNAQGNIVAVNPAFNQIWGNPHLDVQHFVEETRSRTRWADTGQLIQPEEKASLRAIRSGKTIHNRTLEIARFDGQRAFISSSAAPIRDANGHIVNSVVVIQDITENYRLNQHLQDKTALLQQANHDLENFNHYLAHDLRTPLCILTSLATVLASHPLKELNPESHTAISGILQTAETMSQVIKGLLVLSQVNLDLSQTTINMEALVAGLWQERKPADQNIQWILHPLAPAYGDPRILRQVWANLLENAIKFTRNRELAVIEVCGSTTPSEQVYYVKDNGVGFEQQDIDRLFGLFQRLHPTDDFPGYGIGLAIVQRVIQRHGGRVWAEGVINQGATFYFALPVTTLKD